MTSQTRQAVLLTGVVLATCLGVFVMPFWFPPAVFQGVSAANTAGFNNKVSCVAAACLGVFVFAWTVRYGALRSVRDDAPTGRLRNGVLLAVLAVVGVYTSVIGYLVYVFKSPFLGDVGYFVHQLTMHAVFGRRLYTEIESPYGPLMFYIPIWIHSLGSGWQLSVRAAYFITLALEASAGTALAAYVIQALPTSRRWKVFLLLLGVAGAFPTNLGINYTFFRFMPVFALLVFLTDAKRSLGSGIATAIAGEMVCLALSPELGLAFFVATLAYAGYRAYRGKRSWLLVALANLISAGLFLVVAGSPYLKMLKLFAHGLYNLPVEPIPYMLVFLVALVWIVPRTIARFFLAGDPQAPTLAALYLASLVLLPAALGRCDPWHVFWNGFVVLLLSGVGAGLMSRPQRRVWAAALCLFVAWALGINVWLGRAQLEPIAKIAFAKLHTGSGGLQGPLTPKQLMMFGEDDSFDLGQLQAIVGHDRVATPFIVPVDVQAKLIDSGQFTPSYFAWRIAVLDISTEQQDIAEFNASRWALVPKKSVFSITEEPEQLRAILGMKLTYHRIRPPYTAGRIFTENLASRWKLVGMVGTYSVYQRL